ncbi:MAG: hypothetical protein MJZ83_01395 [Bacteroidaceae bacterium]|nr:hypothetical protein [Bacteroidaceae bacterium]
MLRGEVDVVKVHEIKTGGIALLPGHDMGVVLQVSAGGLAHTVSIECNVSLHKRIV